MIFYVDASAVVAVLLKETASEILDHYIDNSDLDFLLSDLAVAESSAAVAKHGRTRRMSAQEVEDLYSELDAWSLVVADPVEVTTTDIAGANSFIRRPGISLRAPDAIHIAAAYRLGATLLTLDHGMARAAAALGVSHLNPVAANAPSDMKD